MPIEYPKALYRDGDYTAVANADEEQAHRADRWTDWSADQARMKPSDEAPALDRAALKAKAKAMGIQYGKTVTTDKLAALVAAKTK